jgi:hypothetical protein
MLDCAMLPQMVGRRSGVTSLAAALLALVLLSFASVQSIVMQATMPASGEMERICGEGLTGVSPASMRMSGMGLRSATSAADPTHKAEHGRKAACPYCAAAAHAPIIGQAIPLRHASDFVYTAFQIIAGHGPRGPPRCEPRARGPPLAALNV